MKELIHEGVILPGLLAEHVAKQVHAVVSLLLVETAIMEGFRYASPLLLVLLAVNVLQVVIDLEVKGKLVDARQKIVLGLSGLRVALADPNLGVVVVRKAVILARGEHFVMLLIDILPDLHSACYRLHMLLYRCDL